MPFDRGSQKNVESREFEKNIVQHIEKQTSKNLYIEISRETD